MAKVSDFTNTQIEDYLDVKVNGVEAKCYSEGRLVNSTDKQDTITYEDIKNDVLAVVANHQKFKITHNIVSAIESHETPNTKENLKIILSAATSAEKSLLSYTFSTVAASALISTALFAMTTLPLMVLLAISIPACAVGFFFLQPQNTKFHNFANNLWNHEKVAKQNVEIYGKDTVFYTAPNVKLEAKEIINDTYKENYIHFEEVFIKQKDKV